MKIKSKYSYGSLYIRIFSEILFTCCTVFYSAKAVNNGHLFFILIPFTFLIIMLILDFSLFYWDTNKISIDKEKRIIIFKNIIFKKEKEYKYDEIEIYECKEVWGGGRSPHKVLYLTKEKKLQERISSAFINNYEEIFSELKNINKITPKNNGIIFYLKKLFGKPYINK